MVLALACLSAAVPAPTLESDDFMAHFSYGKQQGAAAQKAEGEERTLLARQSVKHLRRATEIDPTAGGAWVLLAYSCRAASCKDQEGERAAQKALDLMPGDVLATWTLADYLIDRGERARARTLLRPMLDMDGPMQDQLRYAHFRACAEEAEALLKAGKPKEALELLDDGPLPEGKGRKTADVWIGSLELRAHRAIEGRELEFDPEDPCVHGLLTASKIRPTQPDKARKMFEQVIARCPDEEIVKMARTELELMHSRAKKK